MKRRQLRDTRRTWFHQDVIRGGADRIRGEPNTAAVGRVSHWPTPPAYTLERAQCHTRQTRCTPVRPTGGDRVGASHRLDLRRAKGPPASSWSTFAYSNSFSISRSPILACRRRSSSFRASGARLFRLAWPAARNRSRHCEARAAVIPTARDTDSRSSPRNRRSTTSRFRPTDNRPPRPGPGRARVRRRRPAPSLRVPRSRAGSYRWPVREPRRTGGRCPATAAPGHAPVPGGRAPLRGAASYEAEG